MKKKLLLFGMSFTILSSHLLPISAQVMNYNMFEDEVLFEDLGFNFDYNTMSDTEKELFYKLIEDEVKKAKSYAKLHGDEFDELVFRNQLISLFDNSFLDRKDLRIEVAISNKVVAAGFNVAISIVVGDVGTGAVSAYIRQVGKDAARRMFNKTIISRLIAWGAPGTAGVVSILVEYVLEYTDFGSKIASYLDSIDKRPNNGYFDIY